jgi:hypothetical protein
MIRTIRSFNPYIEVMGGENAGYYYNSVPGSGMMRFHEGNLQVYNGNNWVEIYNNNVSIDFSPKMIEIVLWAEKKMQEEKTIEDLARKNPAVSLAYENLKKAKDQLKVTVMLTEESL